MGEEKKKKRQKKERTEQKNPQLNKKEICLNVKGGKNPPQMLGNMNECGRIHKWNEFGS